MAGEYVKIQTGIRHTVSDADELASMGPLRLLPHAYDTPALSVVCIQNSL